MVYFCSYKNKLDFQLCGLVFIYFWSWRWRVASDNSIGGYPVKQGREKGKYLVSISIWKIGALGRKHILIQEDHPSPFQLTQVQ